MSALQNWLLDEYAIVTDSDPEDNEVSEQMIMTVGKSILQIDAETIDDVVQALGYDKVSSNEELIELLLVYATRCSDCRTFIERIVMMDDADQKCLMDIIQTHSTSEGEEDDVEPEFTMIEPPEAPVQQGSFADVQSDKGSDSILVARLQQELADRIKGEAEKIAELNEIISRQANNTTDAELELLRKDQAICDLRSHIQDIEKRNIELESQCASNASLKEQLNSARDELDILRPQAAKVDAAEAKNEMLKLKLEDLQNVKQQLKTEYENHTATFTELTTLKQEVEGLRKLKPAMDTYRNELAELKITYEECRLRLSGREEEIQALRRSIDSLTGGHQGSLLQTQSLAEELRESQEQLRAMERVGGIGEGMSELNPALMQELKRLQAENADLLSKLDHSSLESLAQLEKNLADAKTMNSSLQKKLLTTKDSLELALTNIETLKLRLTHSQLDYVVLTQQFGEASSMSDADIEGQRVRSHMNLTRLQSEHHDAMSASTLRYEGIIAQISETLRTREETLSEKLAIIEQLTAEGLEKDQSIATLTADLAQTRADLEQHIADNTAQVEDMRATHEKQMTDLQTASETQLAQLTSAAEQEKQALIESHARDLMAKESQLKQVENECGTQDTLRRRADLKRKFFETETHRLKSQLQLALTSNGSGNVDVDTAIKEMKTMQMQLEDANAELSHLRSITGSSSSGAAGGDSELAQPAAAAPSVAAAEHSTSIATSRPLRAVRVKQSKTDDKDILASLNTNATGGINSSSNGAPINIYGYTNYLEQAELNEKKIEQLTKEKREMLSKSLEESKEKVEISQKLLVSEKQVTTLKDTVRKLELKVSRMEREMMKSGNMAFVNDENVINQAR